jgi:Arc/MetJ-type ribon-helix-helix transcriptional regulator
MSKLARLKTIPLSTATPGCYIWAMKTVQIDLPDELARDLENAVETGRFESPGEVVRAALRDFLAARRFELLEQQQVQDITWALREKRT